MNRLTWLHVDLQRVRMATSGARLLLKEVVGTARSHSLNLPRCHFEHVHMQPLTWAESAGKTLQIQCEQ